MDLGLTDDTALVAASSRGLGRAVATAFAEAGADVVINGRDQAALEATAEELRRTADGTVHPVAADLTDPAAIEGLVEATVERFDGLDHLVTNTGGPPSGPFLSISDADWEDAYELLIASTARLCRAVAEPLRADGGGTVLGITSKSVKEPVDDLVLSNATRPAVVNLMKTLSREWAPEVRANVILPGAHATDRITNLLEDQVDRGEHPSTEAAEAAWVEDIPADRIGDPRRFGQVGAFLCSEPAAYINGAAIMVDGGSAHSIL